MMLAIIPINLKRQKPKKPTDIVSRLVFGVPTGIRTPVAAVKGQCPNR